MLDVEIRASNSTRGRVALRWSHIAPQNRPDRDHRHHSLVWHRIRQRSTGTPGSDLDFWSGRLDQKSRS